MEFMEDARNYTKQTLVINKALEGMHVTVSASSATWCWTYQDPS